MATIKIIDPVTRIEGHTRLEIEISQGVINDARVSGTLFRGFENILKGRVPDDAPLLTQRICGVCPVSHAQASVLALENITKWTPNNNGRLLRNLVLGSNFIQSHILHFYLLSLADFAAGPEKMPWAPAWNADTRAGMENAIAHFKDALNARRQADEMGAIFSGKLPHAATYVPGGLTPLITADKITRFSEYLETITAFISNIYIPDVQTLADVYPDYRNIGAGPGNLLAFGAFEQADQSRLFSAGYIKNGSAQPSYDLSSSNIREHVTYSWYTDGPALAPDSGVTNPEHPKNSAYSWIKAPRLFNLPFETGPLARMKINGNYTGGVSVIDRHLARANEALKIVQAMKTWTEQLTTDSPFDAAFEQGTGKGEGLTEAPRGALGHWVNIDGNVKIANYQVITPTCWNASPMDDNGIKGPLEQALIGTPVANEELPIEALRVVHSFDPCTACAVHVMRPNGRRIIVIQRG